MSPIREQVLHADEQILVADKPAGMAAVPGGWEKDDPSLLKQLEAEYGRLWIVHRLDKVTSGVIVFARTAEAHRTLSLLFETRAVHKAYHAILCGVPVWDEYTCRLPLLVDVGHNHRTAVNRKSGQAALTRLRVRERFAAYALVEASPETGRTHQIRAHLSALGFPILADRLYRAPATELIERPALHAYSLELEYGDRPFSFTAPYPEDILQALKKIGAGR
jgi:RluA family pseudouridine synthase